MKDYIEIEGKRYRVKVCWNAVAMYLKQKGVEDLTNFGNIDNMSAEDMLIMMYWSLYYGEQIDGRELPFASSIQLGNVIGPSHIASFIAIFASQMKSEIPPEHMPKEESDVKKKKFSFFR